MSFTNTIYLLVCIISLLVCVLSEAESINERHLGGSTKKFTQDDDMYLKKLRDIKKEIADEIADFHKFLGHDCDLVQWKYSMAGFWDSFFKESKDNLDQYLRFTFHYSDVYINRKQKLSVQQQKRKGNNTEKLLLRRFVDVDRPEETGVGEWYLDKADQIKDESKRCFSGGLLECRPYPTDRTKGYCTCMDLPDWAQTQLVELDEDETYLGTITDYDVLPGNPEKYKNHICAVKTGTPCVHYTPYTGFHTFQCVPGSFCHTLLNLCICPIHVNLEECLSHTDFEGVWKHEQKYDYFGFGN